MSFSKEFGGGGLVESGLDTGFFNGIEESECSDCSGIGGIFWDIKADTDMGLSGEVIDFMGLDFFDESGEAGSIGQIGIVQKKVSVLDLRVLVDMIDALGIKG